MPAETGGARRRTGSHRARLCYCAHPDSPKRRHEKLLDSASHFSPVPSSMNGATFFARHEAGYASDHAEPDPAIALPQNAQPP